MKPKISAYVPAYNNSSTLELAIVSILRQSRQVDELFVVDDGSTDDSPQVAERLGIVERRTGDVNRKCVRGVIAQFKSSIQEQRHPEGASATEGSRD